MAEKSIEARTGQHDSDWERVESDPPPRYSSLFGDTGLSGGASAHLASLEDNGRFTIHLNPQTAKVVEKLTRRYTATDTKAESNTSKKPSASGTNYGNYPPLHIVILIVGSRGDVQPFLALGQELREYGHRVRLATHPIFESLVRDHGLEYFSIGGDPAELMAYMVRNPRLVPGFDSLRNGDVLRNRRMITEIMNGCWKACIDPGPAEEFPFVTDAIIANPPSYAHIHCAERLSVPLHIMFTMPWSSTRYFAHPLANIPPSDVERETVNYLSFLLIEAFTWQGLYDIVNDFRKNVLGLQPISLTMGATLLQGLKIPHTYCWSPSLIPKPPDWADHIDVSGFFFTDGANSYSPPERLERFLQNGEPPVFIGFGSIVVDNADRLTRVIEEAAEKCGVRVVLSEGWSKLGRGCNNDRILVIGDVPHDWLFSKVSVVVHHGGAGTTATGLRFGKPTVIVPFFGDQPFWGSTVAKAGAGPPPIPERRLTAQTLADAIMFCLQPHVQQAARGLAAQIAQENGPANAVESFRRHLPWDEMRCSFSSSELAVWRMKSHPEILLSATPAAVLLQEKQIRRSELILCKRRIYDTENERWDPVTALAASFMSNVASLTKDAIGLVTDPINLLQESRRQSSSTNDTSRDIADDASHGSKSSVYKRAGMEMGAKIGRIALFPLKTGIMLNEAVADGLTNLPKLYGDNSVREKRKVHDLKSGVEAGGQAFYHGLCDGISGLVTQPLAGAQENGLAGFTAGLGRGLAGSVVKPAAGIAGLTGHTFKGIRLALHDLLREKPEQAVATWRYEQGFRDERINHPGYRQDVLSLFASLKASAKDRPAGSDKR
ncbi:putative UDP-glucose,sterol transferase [Thermoascus aurantiacus ATCC 26904]